MHEHTNPPILPAPPPPTRVRLRARQALCIAVVGLAVAIGVAAATVLPYLTLADAARQEGSRDPDTPSPEPADTASSAPLAPDSVGDAFDDLVDEALLDPDVAPEGPGGSGSPEPDEPFGWVTTSEVLPDGGAWSLQHPDSWEPAVGDVATVFRTPEMIDAALVATFEAADDLEVVVATELDLYQQEIPDLVVTDLTQADLDGHDAVVASVEFSSPFGFPVQGNMLWTTAGSTVVHLVAAGPVDGPPGLTEEIRQVFESFTVNEVV